MAPPRQWRPRVTTTRSSIQTKRMNTAIQTLFTKAAIKEVQPVKNQFISSLFLVEKAQSAGEYRPIINLKPLDRFVKEWSFKMEGLPVVRSLIQPNDYMMKLDLKDAYYSVPIHPDHRRFLRFVFKLQREDTRVPMSPLRSEISPSCLHQANDSNYSPYKEFGNTDCHLSRRHSHPTSISQRSTVYLQEDCDPPRAFRIPHQPEQMFATPFPATYLPGNIAQHGHNVSVLAEREAGSYPTGSTPATYQRQRYTTGISYTPGTHEPCSSEWRLAGPSALPSSSEGSFSWNSKIGLQEFEAVPRPVTGGYEGPGMVAVPGNPGHQCSTPQMPTIRSSHSHRCIPIGLGGGQRRTTPLSEVVGAQRSLSNISTCSSSKQR